VTSTAIRRITAPTIAALTLGLALAGCGDNSTSPSAGSTGSGSTNLSSLTGTLAGSGASSQTKAQEAWAVGFQGLTNGNVTVTYDPAGSGAGRKAFIAKGVSFAGSDSYLSDDQGELTAAKTRCGGEPAIEIPAYVSPIAVIFHLAGVTALNLDAKTIANIFNGTITKWNDSAIKALNSGTTLPATTIVVVHRRDDSGTTHNFTDYLSKAGGGAWTKAPSDTYPYQGASGDKTPGMIAAVSAGAGTIGYADNSQVGVLSVAKIKVGNVYTAPSAEGAAKVVALSQPAPGRASVDMATQIDRTTTEAGAYPVVLLSYLIACQHYTSSNEAALVKGFLDYAISSAGQQAAAKQAGSAPLDATVAAKAKAIVDKIAAK
jgi:phosphate transport system substrate-binding protein